MVERRCVNRDPRPGLGKSCRQLPDSSYSVSSMINWMIIGPDSSLRFLVAEGSTTPCFRSLPSPAVARGCGARSALSAGAGVGFLPALSATAKAAVPPKPPPWPLFARSSSSANSWPRKALESYFNPCSWGPACCTSYTFLYWLICSQASSSCSGFPSSRMVALCAFG